LQYISLDIKKYIYIKLLSRQASVNGNGKITGIRAKNVEIKFFFFSYTSLNGLHAQLRLFICFWFKS